MPCRSPLRLRGATAALLASAVAAALLFPACQGASNGHGSVSGELAVQGCRRSGDRPYGPYSFEAKNLATVRFERSLQIVVQANAVSVEETDGLIIRIADVRPLRILTLRPIELEVSRDPEGVNAALSLFDTCPLRPTLHATSGRLVFDAFRIRESPTDAGIDEVISGTLTASVASVGSELRGGSVTATFVFRPEPPSVSEPQ